ncbi:hypothetical protein FH972_016677 [Carpinus fangiana]|uniref:U-box domain-containing protein n=1 Tax=Carpinus fangiana TaxID=176857 RepID=A0A5N6RGM0_9ROSI|nr:hypothetical protein FH972_016677 [Carpinus fangiana]
MKTDHPKLKTQLFSCGFFRHCTQSVLSPTSSPLSPSHPPPPPPPPPPQPQPDSSSSSSSSSTSQSFTQWKFPLPNPDPPPETTLPSDPTPQYPLPPPLPFTQLQELFHIAELQINTGSDPERLSALHLLERSLVPNPPSDPECPPELMRGVVENLKTKASAKPATKILLALCLAEGNRHVAVEAGAVSTVVEVAPELEDAEAERALAALELMCTLPEGAAEVRSHALAVPVMVAMMGRIAARAREYAISVLAVIYGDGDMGKDVAPPEEVARAVVLALRNDCSARGKRKGALLLKALQENDN